MRRKSGLAGDRNTAMRRLANARRIAYRITHYPLFSIFHHLFYWHEALFYFRENDQLIDQLMPTGRVSQRPIPALHAYGETSKAAASGTVRMPVRCALSALKLTPRSSPSKYARTPRAFQLFN